MKRVSRKWKIIIAFLIFIVVAIYIEVLSYILNSRNWFKFAHDSNDDGELKDILRILVVSDAQIQGEAGEPPLLGYFTRWDSDRYLMRNYKLAKHHVKPHVVIFLGDLIDEGTKARDPEFRRYVARFNTIFDLPKKQDPSPIDYLFLPGDNDIGGEGGEPIFPVKMHWFNKTFGDFSQPFLQTKSNWNVQFLKHNLFIPEVYKDPLKGLDQILKLPLPDYRILLSHISMLSYITNSVQTLLDKLEPSLIITAHEHKSTYYRFKNGPDNTLHVTPNFLMGSSHFKFTPNEFDTPAQQKTEEEKAKLLTTANSIRIHLDKPIGKSHEIHEISIPTCSYRMGVKEMGYGAFQIFKNGTMDYTVLWLPSRFNQLYIYLILYLVMKMIFTPWVLWKVCTFARDRYLIWKQTKGYNNLNSNNTSKISEHFILKHDNDGNE